MKLKEVTVEVVFNEINNFTLDHWRQKLIAFSHYYNGDEEKLVQSAFTCLHLRLVPTFLFRNISSIINSFDLSTIKYSKYLKYSKLFDHMCSEKTTELVRVESFVGFVAQVRDIFYCPTLNTFYFNSLEKTKQNKTVQHIPSGV